MLHQRILPNLEAQALWRVFKIKLHFLYWLLRKPPIAGFGKVDLERVFGSQLGVWFFARIQRGANRTQFGQDVDNLRDLAENDRPGARTCANVIRHDAKFAKKWGSNGFSMRFPSLPENWRKAVKDVCVPFYDLWLSKEGFAKEPFGLTVDSINRQYVLRAFRPQSRGVCGYCDGPLGDVGSYLEANDCDHFFPKSDWPYLAIHPNNLFAACHPCNGTWKHEKSPIGIGDVHGFHETYHPEFRPGASAIHVVANLARPGSRKLILS